ncbi:spore germination protein GerPE [Mangrovibacillus cuniculi]|uniref:Spore germination protein GerPE n=1 Tax=Mangrovibacillus cuniculi TaxID=2593652 RepID=A0A7S8HES4_9BACI|nr:spore germination protein GerPE [Mangrovibacillus cuniculi]QPC46027.1 spore germination protein GerPE [Mangrovibacillus cuniculi]
MSYCPRTSNVKSISSTTLTFSSNMVIGDINQANLTSFVLAVQREQEIFYAQEGDFSQLPSFTQPIFIEPLTEIIQVRRLNQVPSIRVSKVHITGISFSSLVQVGSTNCITAQNRTKHTRQLEGETGE